MDKIFRQRLVDRELLIGTFQKTPSMMISEVLGKTDLDVVCLDAEHSPFDRRDIDASLLALRAECKPSLVRPSCGSAEQLLNALDCGATGVLIPHVTSAEMAAHVAKMCRYGDGGRGYAGSTRAALYVGRSIADNLKHNLEHNVVIAQIEDLCALDEIDQIASIDTIDCLFIGMADLTVALGCESLSDEKVVQAAKTVCKAANKHNRAIGAFVANLEEIPFWQEQGVSLFLLASDHTFIKQGSAQLLTTVKDRS